jgi:hypothetical protein
MSGKLADVRATIFTQWRPNFDLLTIDERPNAQQLWEELKRLSSSGAWRSTAVLGGQFVEAHLRSLLVRGGIPGLTFRA